MNKITLYYAILIAIITIQFVVSVISRSSVVQQSAALVNGQRQLAQLEKQETDLVNILAQQTSLAPDTSTQYVAISKPVTLTSGSLVATR